MIAVGVLLVALAVLVGVVVTVEATDTVTMDVLGWDVSTDGIGVFWAGAATMLVAVIGLALVMRGARKGYRVRKENRQLRKEHRRLEQEQAAARSQPVAAGAVEREHTAETPDRAYDPESERAYDPDYDATPDDTMADPYETAPRSAPPPGPSVDTSTSVPPGSDTADTADGSAPAGGSDDEAMTDDTADRHADPRHDDPSSPAGR